MESPIEKTKPQDFNRSVSSFHLKQQIRKRTHSKQPHSSHKYPSRSKKKTNQNDSHNYLLPSNLTFQKGNSCFSKKNSKQASLSNKSKQEDSCQKVINYNNNIFIFPNKTLKDNKKSDRRFSCFDAYFVDENHMKIINEEIKESQLKQSKSNKTKEEAKNFTRKMSKQENAKNLKKDFFLEMKEESLPYPKSKTGVSENSQGKTLWRRISNFIKCLSQFNNYDTKHISSENEIDKEISEHQEKQQSKNLSDQSKNRFETKLKKFEESKTSREIFKISLQEKCLQLILEGDENMEEKLENLFIINPDRYLVNHSDKTFLFNQHLSSKKNLFYIACREGKVKVVEFFLKKKLDPHIPSNNENELETPLEVAARWGYLNIVEMLLDKVNFSKNEIKSAMKIQGISKVIKKKLKNYNRKYFEKGCFACFF